MQPRGRETENPKIGVVPSSIAALKSTVCKLYARCQKHAIGGKCAI